MQYPRVVAIALARAVYSASTRSSSSHDVCGLDCRALCATMSSDHRSCACALVCSSRSASHCFVNPVSRHSSAVSTSSMRYAASAMDRMCSCHTT